MRLSIVPLLLTGGGVGTSPLRLQNIDPRQPLKSNSQASQTGRERRGNNDQGLETTCKHFPQQMQGILNIRICH